MCDMALVSFVRIIGVTRFSRKLLKYRSNANLLARMPDYSVKLGYGMHVGWAIEGAIGSFYKIDASYLSPHVNMSSRLEEATKIYGVPLLITGSLFHRLSPKTQTYLRPVDHCIMTKDDMVTELYTVDLNWEVIAVEPPQPRKNNQQRKLERVRNRMKNERYREMAFND